MSRLKETYKNEIMDSMTKKFGYKKRGIMFAKLLGVTPNDYFEDESGKWIYNIDFHIDGCFASVQLELPKRISITRAVQKARKIFENTRYCKQTELND